MDLRNVAIIAHVDHGKTTLVDAILRQTGAIRAHQHVEDRILDSNALERERGITILSKNTAVFYEDTKINIVDTPGHADFGGEVERIIGMVDGALLVVDAAEGPLPQTRYVLQKTLAKGVRPIVVVNKIDRQDARPKEVVDEVLDLFIDLGATEEQIEFPVVYASATRGLADTHLEDAMAALEHPDQQRIFPLLDTVLAEVPPPDVIENGPLQMLVTNLDHDPYIGRLAIGRIRRGTFRDGQPVVVSRGGLDWTRSAKVAQIFTYARLERQAVDEVTAGDIVAVSGLPEIEIGDTICEVDHVDPLAPLTVDEPTLTMLFRVNDGPFAGQDGKYLTSRQIRDRLWQEARTNVALQVADTDSPDVFEVRGRGELHLGILIETMRREGYEFTVSKPQPVFKTIEGERCEPLEQVIIEVPQEHMGSVMELLGERKGEMVNMTQRGDSTVKLEFLVPARSLVGFRSTFLTETKGYGIMHHSFEGYGPYRGDIPQRNSGSLVAGAPGEATGYAITNIQERARLFIRPGTSVYEGMVIGENSRPQDLDVNIAKKKHVTNMRSAHADISEKLDAVKEMSLEEALAFISEDELVEVTPKAVRLRKLVLWKADRENLRKSVGART